MRQPKGVLLPPIPAGPVRRRDMYRVLRSAVLEGLLRPGERLPSTRQAAADYGASRGLMEEVFGQLNDEGFFERAVGRGTFIAAQLARLETPPNANVRQRPTSRAPSRRGM